MKINKEMLYEFLVLPNSDITSKHYTEIKKVVDIVMSKWWSSYSYLRKEVIDEVVGVILERKVRYNPKMDAYNYIFTMVRNQVGNFIHKLTKEVKIDLNVSGYDSIKDIDGVVFDESVPSFLEKYLVYLLGEVDFNYMRVSHRDLFPLLLFLVKNSPVELKSKLKVSDEDMKYLPMVVELLLD